MRGNVKYADPQQFQIETGVGSRVERGRGLERRDNA